MNDILTQHMKNKLIRIIKFCESERIEEFSFTELNPKDDFAMEFDLEFDYENWNLEAILEYIDFVDDNGVKEDQYFYYKIKGEEFIVTNEDFEEADY